MKKKKKIPWGTVLSLLIGFCLGFFLVWISRRYLYDDFLSFILILSFFIIALIAQTIIHEAGHLSFGLWTGYKFNSFRIFNFMWVKLDGKIRLKRMSVAGTAGQCLLQPPAYKEGIPLVLYNLGGVFANLFASLVFAVAAILLSKIPYLCVGFWVFALVGGLLALTNGIPMRIGGIDNDGANARSLLKSEKARYAFWLQMQINYTLSKGVRLKDMPAEWFVYPEDEDMKRNALIACQGVFTTNYLMDKEQFAEAKKGINKLLNEEFRLPEIYKNMLKCDLFYIALVIDRDEEKAKEMVEGKSWESFLKSMQKYPSVIRTRFVCALLYDYNKEKAEKIGEEFEKTAKSYPYQQEIESERTLIRLAKETFAAEQTIEE